MLYSIVFATDDLDELVPVARAADAGTVHRIWTTETVSRDALIRATIFGRETSRIGVATGIAYAFSRSPVATAIAAADIHAATGGRFLLGLGAGTDGIRRNFYGVEFDHPGPRMAEYVALVRMILTSRSGVSFHGRFYNVDIPFVQMPHAVDLTSIELYGAAVNRIMLSHVARSCDGVMLHPLTASEQFLTQHAIPACRGAKVRSAEDHRVKLAVWVMTSIDEDEGTAYERARQNLAFYLAIPGYASALADGPWRDVAAEISRRCGDGEEPSQEVAALVPDSLIEEITLTGTPDQVSDRLAAVARRFENIGVDELVLKTVGHSMERGQSSENCLRILAAIGRYTGADLDISRECQV